MGEQDDLERWNAERAEEEAHYAQDAERDEMAAPSPLARVREALEMLELSVSMEHTLHDALDTLPIHTALVGSALAALEAREEAVADLAQMARRGHAYLGLCPERDNDKRLDVDRCGLCSALARLAALEAAE